MPEVALQPRIVHAPEIAGEWLNSPPLTIRGLRGRAVLIDFWDYTCVNCIRTLPYVREWHRRYAGKGLTVIRVHSPEFAFARDAGVVSDAIREFDLPYAVLLDNGYRVWHAFANKYWPSKYLVDKDGYLRYEHAGEGHYAETEDAIQQVLRDIDPAVELPAIMEPLRPMDRADAAAVCEKSTPELYLQRARYRPDTVELTGLWEEQEEYLETAGESASLRLSYAAAEVNLVMAPRAGAAVLHVLDNGLPLDHQSRGADIREAADGTTCLDVDRPRMYRIVERDRFVSRRLELRARTGGRSLVRLHLRELPPTAMTQVVAAVIERGGRILVCRRKAGQPHPLKWEFPGGKLEPGEEPRQALVRELDEELGIHAFPGGEITRYQFAYPGKPAILLIFFRVTEFQGEPRNLVFDEIRWEPPAALPQLDFLEGDIDFVRELSEAWRR